MAMTFNENGCRTAAEDLKTSASNLDKILNEDLTEVIEKAKNLYQSNTADELYALYDKMKAKFPEFIDAISRCSAYLSDVVAPSYAKVETTTSAKIN